MTLRDLMGHARDLVERAQDHPDETRLEAQQLLVETADEDVAVVAMWASGLADRELGDLRAADTGLSDAVNRARTAGLDELAAEIQVSLVFVKALRGENEAALDVAQEAQQVLTGRGAARLRMQVGLVLQRMGRSEEALVAYDEALPGLQAAADRVAEVRLRVNRSSLFAYAHRIDEARSDLTAALDLATTDNQAMQMAACAHNLGFLEGRAGDVPAALRSFAKARAAYADAGVEAGLATVLDVDQAELLMAAGLQDEAHETAMTAVDSLAGSGNEADLAEAELLAARTALVAGHEADALALAGAAGAAFERQDRGPWASLAEYVGLQAGFVAENPDRSGILEAAVALASRLADRGWSSEAVHALTIAAQCAIAVGDEDRAAALLAEAESGSTRGPAALRARSRYAEALLLVLRGDPTGALRVLADGLDDLDDYRATFGASELRAASAALGADLAGLGLELALESGDTESILRWVDRSRAGAVALHPALPPDDPELSSLLTRLRTIDGTIRDATLSGRSAGPENEQRRSVEAAIQRRSRTVGVDTPGGRLLDLAALNAALAGQTLVELSLTERGLLAVVVCDGSIDVVNLGPVPTLVEDAERARFDLRRLAEGRGSAASVAAATASLSATGRELQRALFNDLDLAEGRLVIAPSSELFGVPWRVMPMLTERDFAVVPSAVTWQRCVGVAPGNGTSLFVAGPGLAAADAEITEVSAWRSEPIVVPSSDASARRVLALMGEASMAHIAAHGNFRSDNPMFSSLRMADGPLTVYDIERLPAVPARLVLPACDAAVAGVRRAGELLGLTSALLGMGVRELTAPQVPIPDVATVGLMRRFHRNLAGGAASSGALASAIADTPDDDPQAYALRRSFVVMGA